MHQSQTGVDAGQSASSSTRDEALRFQHRALTERAGFRVAESRMLIEISGDDRVAFLHGLCSNDVRNLKPGGVLYSLVLTEHAHVISDFYLWGHADKLWCEIERSLWPRTREHLEKFLIADDVEFNEIEGLTIIDVEGPTALEMLAAATGSIELGELWRFNAVSAPHGEQQWIANVPRARRAGLKIVAESSAVANWRAALEAQSGIEVSEDAAEIVRVESGIPRVGRDTSEKTIALEARLEAAISFNKGCYLGQETIERATARGGLKKKLFGLHFSDRVPEIGAQVLLAGKEVGRVTSTAVSPRLGPLGLSILHHSAWNPGTEVSAKDSRGELKADVSDLPFA
jgi:folate-binding protein YgfZ